MIRIIAVVAALASLASAQNQRATAQSKPSFDVVFIRAMASGQRDQFDSYCANGGRFITRGTPLLWSIKWAYGLNDYQMSPGWPRWLNAFGAYEIEAEADGPVTGDQCRIMVQSLFEHRFQLKMHSQTRILSALALVIAKNGPRLSGPGRVTMNGVVKQSTSELEPPDGWPLARLANYLASIRDIDRPVLDRTGLTGIYGFTLNYSTTSADDHPNIFTALQEQLGLKLRSIKAPIDMFVIDHVEKPSPN